MADAAAGDIHAFPNTEEGINNEASVHFSARDVCSAGTSSRAVEQWGEAAAGLQCCNVAAWWEILDGTC